MRGAAARGRAWGDAMNPIRQISDVFRRRYPTSDGRLRIYNLTRQTELADCVEVADRGAKRRKGLLGREKLSAGEGLWIVPCESVHTFGMRFPIDLVYLDRDKRVKKVTNDVHPWRMSACLSAHSVVELASGSIRKSQTQPGDRLEFSLASMPSDRAISPPGSLSRRSKPEDAPKRGAAITNRIITGVLDGHGFHSRMTYVCAAILGISIGGCKLTSIHVTGLGSPAIAFTLMAAMVLPLPLYWHEKAKMDLFDAGVTIFWGLLLALALPFPVDIAARMGMRMPLQDLHFARLDQMLKISVPGVTGWAYHHRLGILANKSYSLLIPMLPISFMLPALAGKVRHAQQFLVQNLIAFAIGLPIFALFPAVGPWYGYHIAATSDQLQCQAGLFLLRVPGPYAFSPPAGIVCFPSFHVVWAILCGAALWGFRPLRVPVVILSGLIVFSTVTTGMHYFCDVLGGAILAILSIALAEMLRIRDQNAVAQAGKICGPAPFADAALTTMVMD